MADKTDLEEIIYTECKLAPGVFLVTLPLSLKLILRECENRRKRYDRLLRKEETVDQNKKGSK